MKLSLKTICLLAILSSMYSCEDAFETTIEIDPPEYIKRLAVHAFGNTIDNELHVLVTETVGLLEYTNNEYFNDAEVKLFLNDQLIYILTPVSNSFSDYNYEMPRGVYQFNKGVTYRIEVSAPDYPTAIAESYIALDNNPQSVKFEADGGSNPDGYEVSAIDVSFQDPDNQKDFYEIQVVKRIDNGGNIYYTDQYAESYDPSIEEGLSNPIFNDNAFNGELKNIEFTIDKLSSSQATNLYIIWSITSEAHYLFNKTANSQRLNGDNPFSSPVQIYSNFKDGLGIFSISNDHLIKVAL